MYPTQKVVTGTGTVHQGLLRSRSLGLQRLNIRLADKSFSKITVKFNCHHFISILLGISNPHFTTTRQIFQHLFSKCP
jgi:hypothetical protein